MVLLERFKDSGPPLGIGGLRILGLPTQILEEQQGNHCESHSLASQGDGCGIVFL